MPYQQVTPGQEALASYVNTYLMSQAVSTFSSASARSAAITTPIKGQCTTRDDAPGMIEIWDGAAWVSVSYSGGWKTYSPTFTANGTGAVQPAIGNGSVSGKYTLLAPKVCSFYASVVFGTTSTGGRMDLRLTLPLPPVNVSVRWPFVGYILGVGGTQYFPLFGVSVSTDILLFVPMSPTNTRYNSLRNADATGAVGTGWPTIAGALSFDANSQVYVSGIYEIA